MKYHVLLPATERVGGSLDYFQWTTILREVSALTAYHWVYREGVKPWLVADLLILNRQLPRSLANCYEILVRHLDLIADAYGRRGPSQRLASGMLAQLSATQIEDVFAAGPARVHRRLHRREQPPGQRHRRAVPDLTAAPIPPAPKVRPAHAHPHRPRDPLPLRPSRSGRSSRCCA